MGLHPSEILIGYEKASKKCLELLEGMSCMQIENIKDKDEVKKALKTPIASKQFGLEDLLSGLIAEACLCAMPNDPTKFNVDNIRVQRILGGSVNDSQVIHGMVVTRGSETTVTEIKKARIAIFNTSIELQ